MVQRKDSLCYVEFMLGKYRLDNDAYLQTLVANMTSAEQERLSSGMAFEELWKDLWQVSSTCGSYMKEYYDAHRKFHVLRAAGTLARLLRQANDEVTHHPPFDEPEWGFPKGRRNLTETDMSCALREFAEETGLQASNIELIKSLDHHEETFTGTNGIRYRHVYYIARLASGTTPTLPQLSTSQKREIRQTAWWPYAEAQKRIRPQNVERRELFARVHDLVVNDP
jgi:8-oxo-dGTP pyrophosphatase MutT (NUDIX family)